MTERVPFDLDAALAALARDECAARPAVSESLQARVLGDAATAATNQVTSGAGVQRGSEPAARRFRLFGLFDAWSGAVAVAAVVCLAIGIGVGYEVGPEIIDQTGLDGAKLAMALDDEDPAFLWEDVL